MREARKQSSKMIEGSGEELALRMRRSQTQSRRTSLTRLEMRRMGLRSSKRGARTRITGPGSGLPKTQQHRVRVPKARAELLGA